ncbi:MAG: carbamate kinase [Candidatus Sumerlaeia bacterium]|nr:carbamate kinase [Candidatus Sumerlaeia bacterium]
MNFDNGLVLALGGNSIVRTGEKGTITEQWTHTDETMAEIAALWERHRWPLVITHGNGPQMGRILLRSELAVKEVDPLPLDVCVADSQAGMGYMIQQVLGNHLARRGAGAVIVTVITRVEVDACDQAFGNPTKPIGLFYRADEARRLMSERGWEMREDAGRGWRRVVASPVPRRIEEIGAIRHLVERGDIVIAAGGGGIPVVRRPDGALQGVGCVIDKDLASALLAQEMGFRRLVIITGVPRVCIDWGKPTQREVARLSAAEAQRHLDSGQFPAGSMGPKIAAAIDFASHSGTAIITQPGDIEAALAGKAGTWITQEGAA